MEGTTMKSHMMNARGQGSFLFSALQAGYGEVRKVNFALFVTSALVGTLVANTATPAAHPTPPNYVSQALGVLPGDNQSNGFGVNDAGSVVGQSYGDGGHRAF